MDSQSVPSPGPASMGFYTSFTRIVNLLVSFVLPKWLAKNVSIFLETLPRDLRMIYKGAKVIIMSFIKLSLCNSNAVSLFNQVAKRKPNKPCFLFEDQVWTFKEVYEYSNKIAQIFLRAGLKKGDTVALVMTNRPEYCCIWMGLAKIGVVPALINSNLRNQPLLHCISAVSSKAIIYSADLLEAVSEIRGQLEGIGRYYQLGGQPVDGALSLEALVGAASPAEPDGHFGLSTKDHLVYIFTSGTTGLPKAAIMPHSRYSMMALFLWDVVGLREDDIVYDPLPLYHTAGGQFGVSAAFAMGSTVVLRPKFSASNFIPDCIKHNCTVVQYIGELCRYVLAVPEKETDTQHKIRLAVGNGLKPAIWKAFADRFKIPDIKEVYGSTEGNLNFVNFDNKIGAIGAIPRFIPFKRHIGAIIKVDETMQPIRGPDGFCIECPIGEAGMFVGLIPNVKKDNFKEFHGYLDKKETKKKFIYDVFSKGDKAFISGDLIEMDELGYLYFKDRTGDTFRWKGENVATSEVESILSTIIGLRDCIVYGVQIGDLEGRAGMAAIADPSGQFDLSTLPEALNRMLPKYAQPIFIRILKEIEITGTFKLKKFNLVKEGFDPSVIKDPIYFRKGASYVPLTKDLYEQINAGKIPV